MDLILLGKQAVVAKYELQNLTTEVKNEALKAVAKALTDNTAKLLEANAKDVAAGEANGMHPGLVDRLRLTEARIEAMAEGLL